jgi:5-methyltetrahydropteroyltriglutamate--homocysteine methyltransferase
MARILTTHVGSLIRPDSLTDALQARERGLAYNADALEQELVESVQTIVREQAEAGLDVIDDGEMGKVSWITYIYGRVTGISTRIVPATDPNLPDTAGLDPEAHGAGMGLYTDYQPVTSDGEEHSEEERASGFQWFCDGPISYVPGSVEKDIANLKSALQGVDVVDSFMPAVAPGSVYWIKNEHYASDEEFMFAFADALRVEYRTIVDAGIMLHVDDAVMWHMAGTIRLRGGTDEDYRRWGQLRVDALNHALEGIPQDRVRYHICSGSHHAAHTMDPSLRDVIDLVLQVNARYYLIEQSNARHEHEWRIWEDVRLPDDKVVVPGVVTHQTQMVEHPELVEQRLTRLAALIGPERVMAGTDCGFAQTASTRRVPEWTQWAKMRSLVEGARLASEKLSRGKVAA